MSTCERCLRLLGDSLCLTWLSIYPLLAQPHGLQGFCAATLLATTVVSFFTISLILWGMTQVPGWL